MDVLQPIAPFQAVPKPRAPVEEDEALLLAVL
jgi:hypothetical protein